MCKTVDAMQVQSGQWPTAISTSYYTLSMAYCVYCTRPEGAKRPRACAVKYAIRHLRACIVSGLSQFNRPKKARYFSFRPLLAFCLQLHGLYSPSSSHYG